MEAEHARHLLPLTDEQEIAEKSEQAEQPIHETESKSVAEPEPGREPGRQHDEEKHPETEGNEHGKKLGRALKGRGLALAFLSSPLGRLLGAEIESRDPEVE